MSIKDKPIKIIGVAGSVASLESLRRDIEEKLQVKQEADNVSENIISRQQDIVKQQNCAEQSLVETQVSKERANQLFQDACAQGNKAEIKLCDEQIKLLNFKASTQQAVKEYVSRVSEVQVKDLDIINEEILPVAINTGTIQGFRSIVSSDMQNYLKQALLQQAEVFTGCRVEAQEKIEEYRVTIEQYQQILDKTDDSVDVS